MHILNDSAVFFLSILLFWAKMSDFDKHISEEIAVLWTGAQPAVAAFVSSIIPNFQDADDILQNVAVAVIKNYDKYDKDRPFVEP